MIFPYTCPVCSTVGAIYQDHSYPELMTRCSFNCGTRGSRLNGAAKTTNNPQLWITSRCYQRFLEQCKQSQQQTRRMAA